MTLGLIHPSLLRLQAPSEPLTARLGRVAGRGAVTALGAVPGAVLGAVLGAGAGVAGTLRHGRPLHPSGRVGVGALDVTVPRPELGIPLLAGQGEHACTLRWSRAMGLPESMPDIDGLALRLHDPLADLLLAGAGTGPVARHVLVPRASDAPGPLSTVLPVSTALGPLLLGVTPVRPATAGADDSRGEDQEAECGPPNRFHVSVAFEGEPWEPVGHLRVEWGPDREIHFDPVRNPLPGTEQYAVVRAVREPAYLFARLASLR